MPHRRRAAGLDRRGRRGAAARARRRARAARRARPGDDDAGAAWRRCCRTSSTRCGRTSTAALRRWHGRAGQRRTRYRFDGARAALTAHIAVNAARPVETVARAALTGGPGPPLNAAVEVHPALTSRRAAARREPVAALQALGQPERLELADVGLERQLLAPEPGGEVGRAHARARRRSRAASPPSTGRGGSAGSSRASRAAIAARSSALERGVGAQRDPRIRPGEVERDPVGLPLAAQRRARRVGVARSRRGARRRALMRPGSTTSTDSIASSPARVCSVPPALTVGRRQRRNASVISPAAIASRSARRKSIYWFACSAAFKPAQRPLRGSASIAPVCELRRNSRPSAPLSSAALTTSPSGSVTREPAVT